MASKARELAKSARNIRSVARYTANGTATSFAAPTTYNIGYVDVFSGGAKLPPSDFTATDGSNIIFAIAPANSTAIEITTYGSSGYADLKSFFANGSVGTAGQSLLSGGAVSNVYWGNTGTSDASSVNQSITKSSFTGDGSNTSFTLSSNTVGADDILVYVDGTYYHPEEDYNISTAGELVFVTAPTNSSKIRIRYVRTPSAFVSTTSSGDLMTLSGTEDLMAGTGTEDLMV
jgi:hypothetical protein